MKPLASPALEYGLIGGMYVAAGVVLCAVALAVEGPVAAAVGALVTGAIFGTGMYLLVYRRFARDAVRDATAPVTTGREPRRRTRGRAAVGNGAALLLTSLWLHSWERAHGRRLLREPRWRWSGQRGWGHGRGMMDAQDFYAAPL